jgi:hypothetical protein
MITRQDRFESAETVPPGLLRKVKLGTAAPQKAKGAGKVPMPGPGEGGGNLDKTGPKRLIYTDIFLKGEAG